MCIIAVYREKTQLPEEEIESMWQSNPDGVGIAIYNKNTGKWSVEKGIMKLSDLLFRLKELKYLNNTVDTTVVIHFRAATHGGVSKTLTHPFKIHTKDKEMFLFHNGVFSIKTLDRYKKYGSYEFRADYLKYLLNYDEYHEESENMIDPTTFSLHSDTSLFAKYLSELNFESDMIITLLKNPIMDEIISYSKLCICVENESEPILIGYWENDNNRSFSNGGYKYNNKYRSACDTRFDIESIDYQLEQKKPYSKYYNFDDTESELEDYKNFYTLTYKNLRFTVFENYNIATLDYYLPSKIQIQNSAVSLEFDKTQKHIKLIFNSKDKKQEYAVYFYEENKKFANKMKDKKIAISNEGILYNVIIGEKNQLILGEPLKEFTKHPKVDYYYDFNSKRFYKLKRHTIR